MPDVNMCIARLLKIVRTYSIQIKYADLSARRGESEEIT